MYKIFLKKLFPFRFLSNTTPYICSKQLNINAMKRFLLISVLVLLGMYIIPIHSWADDRSIALRAKTESKEPRSLFPVSAWIDSRTVSVSFMEKPDWATVVITMEGGV